MVEEARPEGLVHPLAGEQQVVHLVHALDVAGAVPLLRLQTHLGVSCGVRTQRGGGERVTVTGWSLLKPPRFTRCFVCRGRASRV